MGSNYYYLVADLPTIAIDLEERNYDITSLKEQVQANIPKSDYAHVDMLFAPYDNRNLLNLVLNKKDPFSEKGKYSKDQLKELLATPKLLPSYMVEFAKLYYKDEKANGENGQEADKELVEALSLDDPEKFLLERFYEKASRSSCMFIRKWFAFDRDMRNIQAAISARRLGLPIADYMVGKGDVVDALTKSKAADFGLRIHIDYLDELIQLLLSSKDMLERERKLDLLRWEVADTIAINSHFNISYILSFLQKADIADRWLSLDKETGMAMFKQILSDIQLEFDVRHVLSKDTEQVPYTRK